MRRVSFFVVLCIFAVRALAEPLVCAVLPPDRTGPVVQAEAEALYTGVVQVLAGRDDLRLLERANLKALTDEADLALAMDPAAARSACVGIGRRVSASEVAVLGIAKLHSDYLVSLKRISVTSGTTLSVHAGHTRLPQQLGRLGGDLAVEAFGRGKQTVDEPTTRSQVIAASELRDQCLAARTDQFFPALWERAEKITANLRHGEDVEASEYYVTLIHLSACAADPPEGMVFVPGGWVSFPTPTGTRDLWVEPFFIDRLEVSVAEYDKFLASRSAPSRISQIPAELRPIVLGNATFRDPAVPVCGVTWHAAAAYAQWRGRRLPTVLEWLRASSADETASASTGERASPRTGNLAGDADGFAVLAPVTACESDRSRFDVLNTTGNVREWTSSWHSADAYTLSDPHRPIEPIKGTLKFAAGGGWRSAAAPSGSGQLSAHKPGEAFDDVGFRCAMDFLLRREDNGIAADPNIRQTDSQ